MFQANKVVALDVPQWQAVFKVELTHGAVAIVAVHDTTRGPALGGCRMATYADMGEALTDVLRLSRGMTFKNAIADLPLGGGKSVIICDPAIAGAEREAVLEDFGQFITWVNQQGHAYITAEDMNTTVADMHVVKRTTNQVLGLVVDPSPYTAWGVFAAIAHGTRTFADDLFGGDGSLRGKRVLVQGLGKVGHTLVEHLHEAGAKLFVTDIREQATARIAAAFPDVTVIDPAALYETEVDIFAPCAGGGLITTQTIDRIKFNLLCGAANNQLQNVDIGRKLQARGVAYCPDFVANMGGVCAIQYAEIEKLSQKETEARITETVERRLDETFATAFAEHVSFGEAVDLIVKRSVWPKGGLVAETGTQSFGRARERAAS